ncbi:DUF5665 domain-containing protein [Mechercharimyces sp. CAU 1602]|uniref:DUF5665 domain-containing protein n=1 Tax=Mechercharimyces sp. CAU 1602 TaxID=2973933 RepID=UPI00216266E2|nr:DUF5665 domain-containing protein [Mechercharimyces sp. CAU 1602]MCS1350642.1 DUF5665 domain-containing protein [Mechercharimyces sp. CAU 1602]
MDAEESERQLLQKLNEQVNELAKRIEVGYIAEYLEMLRRPRRLIFVNFFTGIARGMGITIGVTILSALLFYILQALGALNIPIIGDFIADIVKIVQARLELDGRYQ